MIKHLILLILVMTFLNSCLTDKQQDPNISMNLEKEKQAIIQVLNNETKAAFQRDYETWSKYWIHRNDISKTYINFSEDSFSESRGWEEISSFVETFIEEHPEPEPVPELLRDINVRVYGSGAWVNFEQQDSLRGRKYETRLMEKDDDQWKIAGMHTSIYGFETSE